MEIVMAEQNAPVAAKAPPDRTPPPDRPVAPDKMTPALLKLAGAIMLGSIAMQLDGTMVNVAFNTLLSEFGAQLSTIQWVVTGYLLAMAMVTPLTGWAVTRYGGRTVWMVSIAVFLGGSLLCGVAWSAPSLIVFRILQGMGGGMIIPLAQVILAQAAGEKMLGRAIAAIGIPAMLGPVLGPVLGGIIVTELSWRWIFYINLPICLAALFVSYRVMPPGIGKGPHAEKLDVVGLALLSPACIVLIYGLTEAGNHGTFNDGHALIPLALGVVLLVGFALHALRRSGPLIDVRLFKVRNFTMGSIVVFVAALPLFGAMALVPLYYQQVRGDSALHAGLLFAPQGFGMAIALVLSGSLSDKIGPRPIVLTGLGMAAAGGAVFTQITGDTSVLLISAALAVSGAGLGVSLVPALTAALRGLPQHSIAKATTSVRIFQQLGGSFGIALIFVVLQQAITHITGAAGSPTADTLAVPFSHAFWWMLGFTLAAILPAMLLPAGRPTAGEVNSDSLVAAG
jgi:EmrB/QacA subfamily drug resistance transporter